MSAVGDLPPKKEEQGTAEQAVRVDMRNEYERREHHRVIPIVNAAGGTAPVLHKPGLERTEIKNADNIAHRKAERDQDQYPRVKNAEEIKQAENTVERKPDSRDKGGNPPRLIDGGCSLVDWLVIAGKLLLTAHALKPRGEEA